MNTKTRAEKPLPKNRPSKRVGSGTLVRRRDAIDEACCLLHNTGATCAGNTQAEDVEWFARWLYGASNFGAGSVYTMHWSLSNEEFERLGLQPDRCWTGQRWETLNPVDAEAWRKLARLCLHALPHIAERIGHRFMDQAKALRISTSSNAR